MKLETSYMLEDFILNTSWDSSPDEIKERIKWCFIDLFGALAVGSDGLNARL